MLLFSARPEPGSPAEHLDGVFCYGFCGIFGIRHAFVVGSGPIGRNLHQVLCVRRVCNLNFPRRTANVSVSFRNVLAALAVFCRPSSERSCSPRRRKAFRLGVTTGWNPNAICYVAATMAVVLGLFLDHLAISGTESVTQHSRCWAWRLITSQSRTSIGALLFAVIYLLARCIQKSRSIY